ncbi:MAG: futalosine synthase [Archaeoglobus sp.]|nr:MAG: futalosine synthase [Archaeoglobus sp.]
MIRIGKFGLVNNFLPYYFLKGNFEVVESSPKVMALKLLSGEIDYAPVPAYFYLSNKDKLKSHRFCIASDGEVLSVILVSKNGELGDKIAITSETVTSVNLLKIVLKEKNREARLVMSDSYNADELLSIADSALVIGDEAIKARMVYRVVMDLGEEWKDLTGLPMVFGISASLNSRVEKAEVADRAIAEAVDEGIRRLDEVVKAASKQFNLPSEFLSRYFKILTYRLGKKEKKGLEAFCEMCKAYNLIDSV